MSKSMKFDEPRYLLSLFWDKLNIYDANKKDNKTIYEIDNIETFNFPCENVVLYYEELLNQGKSRTYALIISLLKQRKVKSIKLKGHKINVIFNDNAQLTIDLLVNEIIDDMDEIIKSLITNYKNNRLESSKRYIDSDNVNLFVFDKDLKYKSKFEEKNSGINYSLMKRGKKSFNLDEEEFALDVIKNILDNEEREVKLGKKYVNAEESKPLFRESSLAGLRLYGKNNCVVINNKLDFIKIQQLVDSHNENVKIYKKKNN